MAEQLWAPETKGLLCVCAARQKFPPVGLRVDVVLPPSFLKKFVERHVYIFILSPFFRRVEEVHDMKESVRMSTHQGLG